MLVFWGGAVFAQQKDESFWWKVDRSLGLSSTKKIDTTYYRLSPYGWMVNINNNFAMMGVSASMPNIGGGESELKAFSGFNYNLGTTVGYRNLILGISLVRPVGHAKDLQLAFAGNAWGVEFRRYLNDDMSGEVSSALGDIDIERGDIRVESRHLRAYHVFASQKFSLTAANDQRCIQVRSAGSAVLYTEYSRHGIDFLNADVAARFGGLDRMQLETASCGLGYGYNYTPNRGRLLFHAAVVPMFVAIMNECLYDGSDIESHRESRFRMQWLGRFTVNYHFNDRLGVNLIAVYYHSSLDIEDKAKASWNDLTLRATLCIRL